MQPLYRFVYLSALPGSFQATSICMLCLFVRLLGWLCFKQPLWGLFAWFNQWLGSAVPFQLSNLCPVCFSVHAGPSCFVACCTSLGFVFWPVSLPFAACPLVGLCAAVTRPCLPGVVSVSLVSLTGPGTLCLSSQPRHFMSFLTAPAFLSLFLQLSHLSVCPSITVCVSVSVSACLFSKPAVSVTTVYSGTARLDMYCQRRH